MPEYLFGGPGPYHYPATRDAKGILLGMVEPDDIRDLDGAPDRMWREPTAEDRARSAAAAKAAEDDAGQDDPEDDPGGDDDQLTATPAVAPGPVPAPPAVIPPAA